MSRNLFILANITYLVGSCDRYVIMVLIVSPSRGFPVEKRDTSRADVGGR